MTSPLGMFYRLSDGGLVRLDAIEAVIPVTRFDENNEAMPIAEYTLFLRGGKAVYVDVTDRDAIIELLEKQMGIV